MKSPIFSLTSPSLRPSLSLTQTHTHTQILFHNICTGDLVAVRDWLFQVCVHTKLLSLLSSQCKSRTSWVKVNGILYKPTCVILSGVKDEYPVFGKVECIYIVNSNDVFFKQITVYNWVWRTPSPICCCKNNWNKGSRSWLSLQSFSTSFTANSYKWASHSLCTT